jgi:hypothetical protein
VEPVIATLPVAPRSVHSGVSPMPGAAVGQVLSEVAGSVEAGVIPSVKAGVLADPEDVLPDGVVLSELHAATITTADATQTTNATEEYTRKEFTVVTLHPRHRILAGSPTVWDNRTVSMTSRPRQSQNHWTAVQYDLAYSDIHISSRRIPRAHWCFGG